MNIEQWIYPGIYLPGILNNEYIQDAYSMVKGSNIPVAAMLEIWKCINFILKGIIQFYSAISTL